jgi:Icc protein
LDKAEVKHGGDHELPTLIFMHHHPLPIDHTYMDSIALKNPEPFASLINRHAQINGIFCGHVHQEASQHLASIPCFTTPSTCFQIIPHSEPMIIAKGPTAYHEIQLRQTDFDDFVQSVKSI